MDQNIKGSNVNLPACQQPAVCQILPALDDGGMERSAVDMAAALVKAGGRALVISAGGRLVPELLRSGAKHIEFKPETNSPTLRFWRSFKLASILRQQGYDIVHSRTPAAAALADMVARRTGATHITTCHGIDTAEAKRNRPLLKSVARADSVIAVSDYVAGQLATVCGLSADRIITIPPGINLTRFNPAAVQADRFIKLAQKWMLPDGLPVILVPARLTADKGQMALLKALTQLSDVPFLCLFTGDEDADPAYKAALMAAITDMGLEGKVRLTGYCEDMPAAYMLADVVVSPSLTAEAFGRVAAEAFAMGRPVVASNRGAGAELIDMDAARSGWLVDPEDSAALSKAIGAALSLTPADREQLALATRRLIEQNYSLDRMCADTLTLYRAKAEEHSKA